MADESGLPSDSSHDVTSPGQAAIIPELSEYWPAFQEEIASLAEEYRSDGWEVVELHPGDIVPLAPGEHDRWGLDVVVPDDELGDVEDLVVDSAPEEFELFRSTQGEVVFQLIAAKAPEPKQLILVPTYYRRSDIGPTRAAAFDRGEIPIHLRPLRQSPVITFTHEDPDVFFPDTG